MRRTAAVVMVVALAIPATASAHRLDEYLQASRVSLARDRITLEVDLTPGVNMAAAMVALLDRDGDGAISSMEAEAYGKVVLGDMVLQLDERPIAVTLTHSEIPPLDHMKDGLGTIRVRAVGDVEPGTRHRRLLYFRNNHQPAASVYLVNALIPEDRDVGVLTQTRDRRQQSVRVEYKVDPRWPAQVLWLVVAAVALAPLLGSSGFVTSGSRWKLIRRNRTPA